jgi:hypothetical protein
MKPRMENANNAIELYSSESTMRFCITLACQGAVPGGVKVYCKSDITHMARSWVKSVS